MNTESIEKRWELLPQLPQEVENNLKNFPKVVQQILYNRGYATLEEANGFLEASPPEQSDPFIMLGMENAVNRIEKAIQGDQKIIVYGDYDTDGVTATTLMVKTLITLGADVRGYIPNRFDDGYGLNKDTLLELFNNKADLIITVDCGVRAIEEARYIKSLGMDLIVTDHHTVGEELPEAVAVINAKNPLDQYPDKNLAGVGIAYKLASALIRRFQPAGLCEEDLLDLVTLGTVADLVPLVGENRYIVRRGLQHIRFPRSQGLMALMGISGITPKSVDASHIGFSLGPRLNAAGRMASAMDAYHLLMAEGVQEAGELAQKLDMLNRERQKVTKEMLVVSEDIAIQGREKDAPVLIAIHEDFNPGVVGLAASRLVDKYYRPAIVGHRDVEFTRASCRSIPEFHITEALDACSSLLERYGGHAAAAGFTVQNANLPRLIKSIMEIAAEQMKNLDLRPVIQADVEVSLADLRPQLMEYLDKLQPVGYGNPQVTFITRNLKVMRSRTVGKDGAHLKLTVTDDWETMEAIAFGLGYWKQDLPKFIDLLYSFELNEYNGRTSFQLNVQDIKASIKNN